MQWPKVWLKVGPGLKVNALRLEYYSAVRTIDNMTWFLILAVYQVIIGVIAGAALSSNEGRELGAPSTIKEFILTHLVAGNNRCS